MSLPARLRCVLFLFALTLSVSAQETYTWDDFIQDFTSDEEVAEEQDWLHFVEELKQRHENPLNINTAGIEELRQLPFLTDSQIEQIHAYIYLHGEMKTLGELRLVPLIDEETRRQLSLFVYAGEKDKGKVFRGIGRISSSLSTRVDIPLYYREGYQTRQGYQGDPLYHRIKYGMTDHRHLSAAVRVEKDPGERYYDTYGASVMWQDMGILSKAVAGDYRIGFGEGVVAGGARQYSKSAIPVKMQAGLRPMTSMDEVNFLRGGAATLALGRGVELSAWVSWRRLDATLNDNGEVQTLLKTGYHRTASERKSQRDVASTVAGGHLGWRHKGLHLGMTGYYQSFSRPLNPGTQAYRRYYPSGSQFCVVGVNYGYSIYRLTLAGETAYSSSRGGVGMLHRASWLINRRYAISAVQRYYDKRYYSFLASAFGESSTVQNENGVMLHLRAQPIDRWTLVTYLDFFHSPWPRYRMSHSSSGQELMSQLTFQPTSRQSLMVRYQLKRKENANVMEPHHRVKLQWSTSQGEQWQWHFQTTALLHRVLNSNGWGVQETVRLQDHGDQWRLALMGGWFHTDDYLSRIYFYEPALWSSVTSASCYGHGLHAVLTARWTSRNRHWMVEARYAMNRYLDRSEQGSGLQTIYSPWKNDLSAQIHWKF